MPKSIRNLTILLAGLCFGASIYAADPATTPKPSDSAPAKDAAPAAAAPAKSNFSAKSTFRNICGFCHESYGRHAGKGPQLMGDENSDEFLFNRIKNGKPGRMAAFGGIFTDDQIHELVAFIRTLKPNVDP